MTIQLGLISDVHAFAGPVEQALSEFSRRGVDRVICLGDIAGYGEQLETTVELLQQAGAEAIRGNHEQWYLDRYEAGNGEPGPVYDWFATLPCTRSETIAGISTFMVHASPPGSLVAGIRLLDEHGQLIAAEQEFWSAELNRVEYELLLVGHVHQAYAQQLGKVMLVNPGSTAYNHSCAILRLPELAIEWIALSGRSIQWSWNWGMSIKTEDQG